MPSVGRINDGIDALMRARALATELASADIPLLGRARTHAKELRSDAVEQARLAQSLLGDTIFEHWRTSLNDATTALAEARLGESHIRRPATELATVLESTRLHKDVLRTRIVEEVQGLKLWNDPELLRARIVTLLDQQPTDPNAQLARNIELSVLVSDAPAASMLAPAMPKSWVVGSQSSSLQELLTHRFPSYVRFGERVTQHIADGSYATADSLRTAFDDAVATASPTNIDDALSIAALIDDAAAFPWAKDLVSYADGESISLVQATALESTRLAVTGHGRNVAALEQETDELIRHAASPDGLDVAGWARLRARLFDHGMADRMGLGPRRSPDGTTGADPRRETLTWHDSDATVTDRDTLITGWAELRHFHHGSDEQLARETLDLIDQWPASRDTLRRQLLELGLAKRLDVHLDRPVKNMSDAMRYDLDGAVKDVARWSLQLEGVAGNPVRADARARELIARGPDLNQIDQARLRVLVRDEGVAERLGLPAKLDGENAYVTGSTGMGDPSWRYQRLWKQLVDGELHTPQDAAARTRALLQGPLDDLQQLHRLGTASVDAGGARELGLPLQLVGLAPAAKVFRGADGLVIPQEILRYATTWRGMLNGQHSDVGALQRGLTSILEIPEDYHGRRTDPAFVGALNDIFVHGFDLPGAPLRGMEDLADGIGDSFARTDVGAVPFIRKWQHAISTIIEPASTATRVDRMRSLVAAERIDDRGYAELFGHLHALGDAASSSGIDVGKLRALLVERVHGRPGSNIAGARARLLLRESLGIETPREITSESFAHARGMLDIDTSDGEAIAATYAELIDRQLLARLLPVTAAPAIARLERALLADRTRSFELSTVIGDIRVKLLQAERLRHAQEAGVVVDPITLRNAVAQLDAADPKIRSDAALDVLLHGFDLPGAPLTRMRAHLSSLTLTQQGHVTNVSGDGTWKQQLQIATQDVTPASRVERLRELATAERGDVPTYAEAFAHLVALGDDAGEVGGVPLAGIRDLFDARLHGSDDPALLGARGWVRMREAFGLEVAPVGDDIQNRVQRALAFDPDDLDSAAAAYVELYDRGLLARAPRDATAEELARYGELLALVGKHPRHVASQSQYLNIEIDPDGALRRLIDDGARPGVKDAHDVLRAIEQHPRVTTPPTTAQRATVLAMASPTDLDSIGRWLQQARGVLTSNEAAPLGNLARDLVRRVDVNLERLAGRNPVGEVRGYGKHPDYADVGRVRSGVELLAKVLADAEKRPTAAAADAAAGVEKLTW